MRCASSSSERRPLSGPLFIARSSPGSFHRRWPGRTGNRTWPSSGQQARSEPGSIDQGPVMRQTPSLGLVSAPPPAPAPPPPAVLSAAVRPSDHAGHHQLAAPDALRLLPVKRAGRHPVRIGQSTQTVLATPDPPGTRRRTARGRTQGRAGELETRDSRAAIARERGSRHAFVTSWRAAAPLTSRWSRVGQSRRAVLLGDRIATGAVSEAIGINKKGRGPCSGAAASEWRRCRSSTKDPRLHQLPMAGHGSGEKRGRRTKAIAAP